MNANHCEEYLKNMLERPLDLDDTFKFKCKACGKCCNQRRDLVLFPHDIYRIAKHLGRTVPEILMRYTSVFNGETSLLPVVVPILVPPNNTCVFQRNKKCTIHQAKLATCAYFPLGRGWSETESKFFLQDVPCGASDPKAIKVRDWIGEDLSSDETVEIGVYQTSVISRYYEIINDVYDSLYTGTKEAIFKLAYLSLYFKYDTERPFHAQQKIICEAFLDFISAYIGTIKKSPTGNCSTTELLAELKPLLMRLHALIGSNNRIFDDAVMALNN